MLIIKKIFQGLVVLSLSVLNCLAQSNNQFAEIFQVNGPSTDASTGRAIACTPPFSTTSGQAPSVAFIGSPNPSGTGFVEIYDAAGVLITTISSTISGEQFGFSLDIISDIDSDGLFDAIIGAPGGNPSGAAYIFSSSTSSLTPVFSSGLDTDAQLGFSVSGLESDVSSDGTNEVSIGAPFDGVISATDLDNGSVAMVDPNSGSILGSVRGAGSNDQFGTAIASIDDLDSDGFRDIIVGAPNGGSGGYVQVISSDPNAFGAAIYTLNGPGANSQFGLSVANVGDIDGDSIEDILVGAPSDSSNSTNSGRAILYSGANGATLCDLVGTSNSQFFGFQVRGLDDVDSDGFIDFAISSPGNSIASGKVDIFHYEPANSLCASRHAIGGQSANEQYGVGLAGASSTFGFCDFNLDGIADFGVGTAADINGTDSGQALFYLGTQNLPTSSNFRFRITNSGNFTLTNRYSIDPGGACRISVFGRATDTLNRNRTRVMRFLTDIPATQITQVSIRNLSKARKIALGRPYVYHMIVRNQCGNTNFLSNVFARKLICGLTPSVELPTWETQLKTKLNLQASRLKKKLNP